MDDEVIWTSEECADFLRVPKSRLEKARIGIHSGPPYIKLGYLVRYRRNDVLRWLSSIEAKI